MKIKLFILEIPVFRDMKLQQQVIGSHRFKTTYCPHLWAALYRRKTECSAIPLQKPQNSLWSLFCRFPSCRI